MSININENLSNYLHLYADYIPVKGATRSAIYDLTRNELIFFPSEYFEVLEYLIRDKLGDLLNALECEDEKKIAIEFTDFLYQNEFVTFLQDSALFPALQEQWDTPSIIQNAI